MGHIVERGHGRPIVLIPGIQGRHEWSLPTAEALAALGHVVTFSLADEPTSGFSWAPEHGFENYLDQLDEVLAVTGVVRPLIVGLSYGGLIAAESAARHPDRYSGLVVASAPPPSWHLPARAQRYLQSPRLLAPVFWAGAPLRVYPELKASLPHLSDRWHFALSQGRAILRAPASSARMVARLRLLETTTFSEQHPIDLPSLIVTGEAGLERVVPPADTLQYKHWLPSATVVTLPHTGHNGCVMRAHDFATAVARLIDQPREAAATRPSPAGSEFARAH